MVFGYFTLAVALAISAIAEFYSIAGLIAIFAASPWAVAIMGAALGVGKITAAVWLKINWHRANWTYKLYLVPAVAFLMALTSMGIFGYLSKAHSEQSLVSGDAQAQLAIYDEKIKTQRDAIELNRRTLEQMDQAVDQVLSRSTNVQGATRSAQLRRSQQAERARLLKEIEQSQQTIAQINEQRAPIANEIRKIEAEVGPIKYIAAMIYGDNPDTNLLEQAVRWVIIMIVIVFDPLALVLILAAQQSLRWHREEQQSLPVQAATEPVTEPVSPEPTVEPPAETPSEPVPEPTLRERYPYLFRPFAHFSALRPMVASVDSPPVIYAGDPVDFQQPWPEEKKDELVKVMQEIFPEPAEDDPLDDEHPDVKAAMARWKAANPGDTLKHQRQLLALGQIDRLPWMDLIPDNLPKRKPINSYGITFPTAPVQGDTFVKVDRMPHQVYKFNRNSWIPVDKDVSDSYTYDTAYIDFLIEKINNGEYDVDLLNNNEREQIAQRIESK